VDPRQLDRMVEMARVAEDSGIDAVMLSEHIVLGPTAGASGMMGNPRDYAVPGNQDPAMPWPDSVVIGAAIAAATKAVRIVLAAVIAPLRHPLPLAKQLATLDLLSEGRLVVLPTVGWQRTPRAVGQAARVHAGRDSVVRYQQTLASGRLGPITWRTSSKTSAGRSSKATPESSQIIGLPARGGTRLDAAVCPVGRNGYELIPGSRRHLCPKRRRTSRTKTSTRL
jgi:alkanesulfonate monooxygenase SsuD/methylene tetrahydromethanopterin reductase-like flavin-dependent oxidoreductase (luciferase family)